MSRRKPGFVYILRNTDPVKDNEIKIGYSCDPYRRARQLRSTGVVYPFEIYDVWAVSNMYEAERIAHERMSDHRIVSDREFFYIIPDKRMEASFMSEFVDELMTREEMLQNCLDSLIELIDDDFQEFGLAVYNVDIEQLKEYSKQRRRTLKNPENPNRFAPLFWHLDDENL